MSLKKATYERGKLMGSPCEEEMTVMAKHMRGKIGQDRASYHLKTVVMLGQLRKPYPLCFLCLMFWPFEIYFPIRHSLLQRLFLLLFLNFLRILEISDPPIKTPMNS